MGPHDHENRRSTDRVGNRIQFLIMVATFIGVLSGGVIWIVNHIQVQRNQYYIGVVLAAPETHRLFCAIVDSSQKRQDSIGNIKDFKRDSVQFEQHYLLKEIAGSSAVKRAHQNALDAINNLRVVNQ